MRTVRISARVSQEEYEMLLAYAWNTDKPSQADLIVHALKALLRADKRNVPEKYHHLIEKRT